MSFRPVYLWVTDGPFFESVLVINNPQGQESPVELTFYGCDGKVFNQLKLYNQTTQELPLGPFLNGHKYEWGMKQGYLQVFSELKIEAYFKPIGAVEPEVKSLCLSNFSELTADSEVNGRIEVSHRELKQHYIVVANRTENPQSIYVRLSIGELSVSRVSMVNPNQLVPIDVSSEVSILEKGCEEDNFEMAITLSSSSLLDGEGLLYLLVMNHKSIPLV